MRRCHISSIYIQLNTYIGDAHSALPGVAATSLVAIIMCVIVSDIFSIEDNKILAEECDDKVMDMDVDKVIDNDANMVLVVEADNVEVIGTDDATTVDWEGIISITTDVSKQKFVLKHIPSISTLWLLQKQPLIQGDWFLHLLTPVILLQDKFQLQSWYSAPTGQAIKVNHVTSITVYNKFNYISFTIRNIAK